MQPFTVNRERCAIVCLHDDYLFLPQAIRSCRFFTKNVLCYISQIAWNGSAGDWQLTESLARDLGAEVITGRWETESEQRRFALADALSRGFSHALIPDGDEVLDEGLASTLRLIAEAGLADRVYAHMDTYWKSARYVVRPRERLTPAILLNLHVATHRQVRDFVGGRPLVLGPEYGVIHHLSYAGPDERIQRKLNTWSHRLEVVEDWYERTWLGWDNDKLMRDLHPTHPAAYGFAEPIELPEILFGCWDDRTVNQDPVPPLNWPRVSVIIPLHGGELDIRNCLKSLEKCRDLLHETIVVDDKSPDRAADVVKSFKWATLLKNKQNLGFGTSCNKGWEASTGDVTLFLNSDTIVPRAGLVRLIESLISSGTVGATGPYTNNAGYDQPIRPTYTDISNLDLFARDFAYREAPEKEVSLLVGFCLAVRSSVLREVGSFDPRFGIGLFEDNDLCYRIQRAGYKLKVAGRSYVHHEGSKSLSRQKTPAELLLNANKSKFREKWSKDLASEFASHLPGDCSEPITFRQECHADAIAARAKALREKANVSLCMIVRDEERVITDCLESASPYFKEIRVVDTGSKDKTVDIVKRFGATLTQIKWSDSFAEARNASIKGASGKWIFWMDADDTIEPRSAEAILNSAINAPKNVVGFVVPVQFVTEGVGSGTRVDHVKLFRNISGLKFEGRIHEQILASLRPHGEIARLDGAMVLHSGYDTSPEGQAKKRMRDEKLLALDLADRPEHPFVEFNIGMTAHFCGDHQKAIEWLDRSIEHSGENDSHIRKAFALKGVSHRLLGDLDESIRSFVDGTAKVGNDPELLFQWAISLCELHRLDDALAKYFEMKPDTSGFFSSIDIGILGFKRSANIGRIYLAQGDYRRAKEWLWRAFEENPAVADSAIELACAAMEMQDFKFLQQLLDHIKQRCGPLVEWAEIQSKLLEIRGESPMEFLWANSKMYPCAIGPRLLFTRRLLAEGLEVEAQYHLEVLDGLGCAEAAYYRGVSASRSGQYTNALVHMKRALELNPGHQPTQEQIKLLEETISKSIG